jgi:hypothetical protein
MILSSWRASLSASLPPYRLVDGSVMQKRCSTRPGSLVAARACWRDAWLQLRARAAFAN